MSHHGWSRVGKSTEGRWSGVKSTDSNPLVYIQVQGTWLLPGLFLDRSRNAYIDSTEFQARKNCHLVAHLDNRRNTLEANSCEQSCYRWTNTVCNFCRSCCNTRSWSNVFRRISLHRDSTLPSCCPPPTTTRPTMSSSLNPSSYRDTSCALSSPTTNTIRTQRCSKKPSWVGNILVLEKQACIWILVIERTIKKICNIKVSKTMFQDCKNLNINRYL